MSQLGIGVLIKMLSGNRDTAEAVTACIGKVIASVVLTDDDKLRIGFTDRTTLQLWDGGQSCCEHRYMRTDDDLQSFVGATLVHVEVKDAPTIEDGYDVHEVQFLEVMTSKGALTMASHNEHNGYYGGFSIEATVHQ